MVFTPIKCITSRGDVGRGDAFYRASLLAGSIILFTLIRPGVGLVLLVGCSISIMPISLIILLILLFPIVQLSKDGLP